METINNVIHRRIDDSIEKGVQSRSLNISKIMEDFDEHLIKREMSGDNLVTLSMPKRGDVLQDLQNYFTLGYSKVCLKILSLLL